MSDKISEFIVDSDVTDSSLVTYVKNGQNFTVTQAEYVKLFGVTGSIVQEGSVTGTPVLDVAGTVRNIRNLENGSGVKASVSAQNGVTLEHNFLVDTVGTPIMNDSTLLQPTFPSLLAGTGMQISETNNVITITATGALPATKTVAINQESDFPTAVAGVITLEAGTIYLVSNNVSTASRFIMQDGTSVVGHSLFAPTLTYTGSAAMFTAVDANVLVNQINLSAPTAKIFDFSETTGQSCQGIITNVVVTSCDTVGTFNDLLALTLRDFFAVSVTTTGVNFLGSTWQSLSMTRVAMISASATFKGVDLGSAIFLNLELDNLIIQNPTAGSFGISGLVSSGNLPAGSLGTISNSTFDGAIVALENITVDDIRWNFRDNTDISNTRVDGLLSMQGNAIPTVIAGASTDGSNAALILGTWTVQNTSKMTGTAAGKLTMDSEVSVKMPAVTSVSVEPVSGTNIGMSAYYAFDGVVDVNTRRAGAASAGSPASITLPWQKNYDENDTIEVYVENNDNSTNILVSSAIMMVN
jgi:hypothetical protein